MGGERGEPVVDTTTMRIERSEHESLLEHSLGTLTQDSEWKSQDPLQERGMFAKNKRYLGTTVLLLACLCLAVLTNNAWQQHDASPTERRLTETPRKEKILYIVTTLAEYNSGTRSTVRGSDRLQETLIPVVSEGVRSMVDAGYEVDCT